MTINERNRLIQLYDAVLLRQIKQIKHTTMTREEEMMNAAEAYADEVHGKEYKQDKIVCMNCYLAGWQDADKSFIDKACEWLSDWIQHFEFYTEEDVERFRNAMKGGEK